MIAEIVKWFAIGVGSILALTIVLWLIVGWQLGYFGD